MIRASRMQPDDVPQGMRELRHVYAELAEVSKDYHEARQQANLDKLTGLYNRRFFDERVNRLLFEHQPFCLAMVDLDDFKRVNDTFGHQTGDVVLKRVSKLGMRLLGITAGSVATVARLVVLLVNPDIHFCQMLLEQFRKGWSHWTGASPSSGSPSAAGWWPVRRGWMARRCWRSPMPRCTGPNATARTASIWASRRRRDRRMPLPTMHC